MQNYEELFEKLNAKIWDYAELKFEEYQSSEALIDMMKAHGFSVERGLAGMDTAFRATAGKGRPVIGLLAEYDALSGLSQKAGQLEPIPRKETENGHGCGHCLLGTAAAGAALMAKDYLIQTGREGTVVLIGCPAEEGGSGKAYLARAGVFDDLDAALTWHPAGGNAVLTGSLQANCQAYFRFHGVSSHAAGSPHLGRSALDAVELMNVGVQFLREHMPQEARIHYAITDAGGNSPNVVQPHAQVLYMVRSQLAKDALALQERVDKIAQGAAMMTETTVKKRFIDGCSNTVPNKVLEQLLYKNFSEIGVPQHTEQEIAYAQQIIASYEMPNDHLPGNACDESEEIAAYVDKVSQHGTVPLNDFLVPYLFSTKQRAGSTDVGDVSWLVPTAQINTVTFPSKAPGHSWQNVSCGRTSIGHKGLLTAGKVLAATAIDLFEQPQLLEQAKEEFSKRAAGGYFCPVPEDAVPTVVGGQF